MAEISIQAKETFSTGLISMYEGEIREISEEMPEEYIEEYTALLQGGNIEIYTAPIVPTGTKDITANADAIDVAEYANVNVNVPNPSTGTRTITSNGTYDVTNYASASVNVPSASWQGQLTFINNSSRLFEFYELNNSNGKLTDSFVAKNGGTKTMPATIMTDGHGNWVLSYIMRTKTDNSLFDFSLKCGNIPCSVSRISNYFIALSGASDQDQDTTNCTLTITDANVSN